MKRHLDNPSSSGRRTKGSFDLLASVPARKGLGMLPEEASRVSHMLRVCAGCGWKKTQGGRLRGGGRGREKSPSFSVMSGGYFVFLGIHKHQARRWADLRLPG